MKPGKYVISIGNPGFRYLEVTENGKMWIIDHVAKVPLVIREWTEQDQERFEHNRPKGDVK